uniref:Uncharacterized protein n=1 Tax=Anguilla anguilla TaxID=7936 RepID=A0A0E9TL31_ANGAN
MSHSHENIQLLYLIFTMHSLKRDYVIPSNVSMALSCSCFPRVHFT